MTAPKPSPFAHLRDELVHQGAVVGFYDGWFRGPDGQEFRRDVVRHPGAVSAVAIDRDTDSDEWQVYLVRQYRAPIDTDLWEIPAGKLDVADEEVDAAIARELAEEIGRRAGSLVRLLDFHHSPGFCDELQHIYLARDLTPVARHSDGLEEEHMLVNRLPLTEAVAMALDGRITDGKSIAGLLAAARTLGV